MKPVELKKIQKRLDKAAKKGVDHFPKGELIPTIEALLKHSDDMMSIILRKDAAIAKRGEALNELAHRFDSQVASRDNLIIQLKGERERIDFAVCGRCNGPVKAIWGSTRTVYTCDKCGHLVDMADRIHPDSMTVLDATTHGVPEVKVIEGFDIFAIIEKLRLGFHDGSAMKYIFSAQYGGEFLLDIRRARAHLTRLIDTYHEEITIDCVTDKGGYCWYHGTFPGSPVSGCLNYDPAVAEDVAIRNLSVLNEQTFSGGEEE